mgnify:CR=1 FL=1
MTQTSSVVPEVGLSQRKLVLVEAALGLLVVASALIFGVNVLFMAVISVVSALAVEFIFAKGRKRPLDRGWLYTPLLITLLLPPTAPLWMAAIGAAFGTFFGKAVFGGYGRYVFNPAVVGVLFLTFAFPTYMLTRWLDPVTSDIVATATPLITLKRALPFDYTPLQLLLGNVPGTTGETIRLAILALGGLLMAIKALDWKAPLTYVATVYGLNFVGMLVAPDKFRDPLLSILVGGVLFAAFLIVGDPVTVPKQTPAKLLYGFGLGLITVVIRNFATFPEGVTFALIIMSPVGALLDRVNYAKAGKKA